ncbi:putative disease resistance RPP13-like protein 1 [Senna tora]|uniref:Putative disease resistance RPP13-like protein 1 n=1 Tax=Senna tora TaxID=362788 RepID=A0A834TLQ5_9FABA|nr:putative disease resistance RPP13-like protein 1 [Senna tora]
MAGAMIGEAFLSGSVQVLLDSIASHEFRDLFRNKEAAHSSILIKNLKTTLLTLWHEELKNAVYDAEDLLDEKLALLFFSSRWDDENDGKLRVISIVGLAKALASHVPWKRGSVL